MTLAQLESDLRAANDKSATLIKDIGARCNAHTTMVDGQPVATGRVWNDEERAQIKAAVKDAETIAQRIEVMKGDAALVSRIDELKARAGVQPSGAAPGAPIVGGRRLSLGQQFASNAQIAGFFKAGLHRSSGNWSTPGIECFDLTRFDATTITEDPASAGTLIIPQQRPGILMLGYYTPRMADLVAPGTATSTSIAYMKEKAFTNAADMVKEGGVKPESALTFEGATAPVRKCAHWLPASEEILEDVPQMTSIIDARLTLGLQLKEDDQILNGDGVDPNVLGFNLLPGLAAPVAAGGANGQDAILKQMTAIATTTFITPDGWVMNPTDWMNIQLTKNTMGNYMGSGPWTGPQAPMLWGLGGVVTPAEAVGEALVGCFKQMSQLFRKGGIRIDASNSHVDFFVKNLVAIRGEERFALAVYREQCFGKVTGLTPTPPAP